MAVPIFVLGLQRSGTTWIANLLAGSGKVAAVTAEEHRGVHESVFFSHFAVAFGPFSDEMARARFRDAFVASDYFILTGLPETELDRAMDQAHDYAGVFAAVMDRVATRDDCSHWIEKSPHHTALAEDLAARFPDALFVCVLRSSPTLVASRLSAYGRTPPRGLKRIADIVRGAVVNSLYVRRLQKFAKECDRALLLNYEAFLADQTDGARVLTDFLGLDLAPEALHSRFEANTSHSDERTRKLTWPDRVLLALADQVGRALPLALLLRLEKRRRRARGLDWPDWVWLKSGFRPF